MNLVQTNIKLKADHGVVSSMPHDFLGYFGWPTLAKMEDGTLVAAASGLRNEHMCPFGRNVICVSRDQGQTWSSPRVVNDSPLDDRDTGVLGLAGDRLLLSWFTTDNRRNAEHHGTQTLAAWKTDLNGVTDVVARRWEGAWICISEDCGQSWDKPVRVPVTAPHGPIRLSNENLLFLGKNFRAGMDAFQRGVGAIETLQSRDAGKTWETLGKVPLYEGTHESNYHEPHVAQLPSGRLLGLIRFESGPRYARVEAEGLVGFSLFQTHCDDGGRTWTTAQPLGFHGAPPHLLVHSSGVLMGSYTYRQQPYGERIMISHDDGSSWEYDYILRDDGPDRDLGYPSSVELDDGSMLTLYYQKRGSSDEKCSLLWSRWRLPQ